MAHIPLVVSTVQVPVLAGGQRRRPVSFSTAVSLPFCGGQMSLAAVCVAGLVTLRICRSNRVRVAEWRTTIVMRAKEEFRARAITGVVRRNYLSSALDAASNVEFRAAIASLTHSQLQARRSVNFAGAMSAL